MKHIFLILFVWLCGLGNVAQAQDKYTVSGTVKDEKGETMIGVTIVVKNEPGVGVVTDIDGKFTIRNIAKNSVLQFTSIGYDRFEYLVQKSVSDLGVVLKESKEQLEEVVVVGHGTQKKISVVGAVTTIDPKDLQVPATSVTNMLGGRVPGIIAVTRSGEPGNDFSEFWIRGISTFGANKSALVLIDGVEGDLNNLDPSDIESFSVLKDASSTAVYGVRGANGVVLVTTKRGKSGKLSINFKNNITYSYSPIMPDYAGASDYAALANEARAVRGYDPIYTDVELELFQSGLDPDLYPNVNWRNVILKNHTWNHQHYLSLQGGGDVARYFMSVGLQTKTSVLKQDKSAHSYDTDINWHKYNFRANIDANLTKTTVLSLMLEDVITKQNAPGYGDDNKALWAAQANLTPVIVPVRYSNGQLPAYGTNADEYSPYVLLNYTGYKQNQTNTLNLKFSAEQDLSAITKGLSAKALFSFYHYASQNDKYDKMPDLYYTSYRNNDGSLATTRTVTGYDGKYSSGSHTERKYYFEGQVNYNQVFADRHRVTGLVHYYMQDFRKSGIVDYLRSMPERYQALSGRLTYSYDDTYFLELNAGYSGSENFKPGEQFGFFPSISGGWIPTQYDWMRNNLSFISFLKFRASYGIVGNDRITDARFPYLTYLTGTGGYWFSSGITESQVGVNNLKWEKAKKWNFGVDLKMNKDRFDMTMDFFKDIRDGIYQERAMLPVEVGAVTLPYVNIGAMKSWGIDGNVSYTQPVNKNLDVTLRANLTWTADKVTHWEQTLSNFPYQDYSGVPYGIQRGLVALGLFRDSTDIMSSPKQTYTDVRPGDIKYKDVNGDGKIDQDDQVPLRYSKDPKVQYGFAAEIRYKKWTFSAFFEGVGKVEYFQGGTGYYPFAWESRGNLLQSAVNSSNRWTPAWYSGNPATENPDAKFPRLTYGDNANNNQTSTFWLRNGRYLRFKNVDISYRWENNLFRRWGIQAMTLQAVGDNLHVWSKVKEFDPGQASANGTEYPLQRTYTFQLTIQF